MVMEEFPHQCYNLVESQARGPSHNRVLAALPEDPTMPSSLASPTPDSTHPRQRATLRAPPPCERACTHRPRTDGHLGDRAANATSPSCAFTKSAAGVRSTTSEFPEW
jgi:hypothetical protein